MPQPKPYPNIYRHGPSCVIQPFLEEWRSDEGIRCFAAYELLKKDLQAVFEYIEPTTPNLGTYSHRTYELLLRACTEVETLCKQVFEKNHVTLGASANMVRYSDLDGAMHLSSYEILCYGFSHPPFVPFAAFSDLTRANRGPDWYRAYNSVKHDRTLMFQLASLGNTIRAVGAVHALLVAQFGLGFDHVMRWSPEGMTQDTPDMFRPRDLPHWSEAERYEYSWNQLRQTPSPYQYHALPEVP